MMCPLSVLILGNFCGEKKIGMTSPQIDYFLVWILDGSNSTGPKSFLTMVENQRVRHPDPIGIRFDPSGRISRVAAEVRPHEDWLLLHPLLSFPTTGVYCLTV